MEVDVILSANKVTGKVRIIIPIESKLTMTRASVEAILRSAVLNINDKKMERLLKGRESGTVTITIETGPRTS
ncbi:MAG: hypothetical protein O2904_00465 [bacterium]|nr:hypothetical protein [bacterium]